jgi:hypothetical protein
VKNEGLAKLLVSPEYQAPCDEKDQRLSATVKQNPKIDANVESQVSKRARSGAPPVFLCQHLRHNYSRRRCRPPAYKREMIFGKKALQIGS